VFEDNAKANGIELVLPTDHVGQSKIYRTKWKAAFVICGDGRIPSGILVASMTGVRLSFRRLGLMPVRVHSTPIKHEPKPSSGPLLAHVKWCPRPESNGHSLRNRILSGTRLAYDVDKRLYFIRQAKTV
jgi:hypothetical protein